jgi:threonine/homoserine/homoserine lactone efflux protein
VIAELAAFFLVATVVIVTPGPDTALTIRNTLAGGRRSGIFTALGVSLGQATWAVATALGIATLLAASEPAFRALKLIGAVYLVFLGVQSLHAALGRKDGVDRSVRRDRLAPRVALRQGVVSNLTNPKMAAFFPALLPQFVPAGDAAFALLLGLGLLFALMTLAWLTAYSFAVARVGAWLGRPGIRGALDAAFGVVLVALGLRLATERR